MAGPFSKVASNFGNRMAKRVDEAGGQAYGFDILGIATLFLSMLPQVMQLFAACKTQPPVPPPIPKALEDAGVTEETWGQAHGAKFAAKQSAGEDEGGFDKRAINRTAKEIAKSRHIKKKAAKPMAIASLQTARDEAVDKLAIAMQEAKNNEADLDV